MNMWGPEMAPHTPQRSGHPGGAGAPLGIALRPEMAPHTIRPKGATPPSVSSGQRSPHPGGAGARLEIPRGSASA